MSPERTQTDATPRARPLAPAAIVMADRIAACPWAELDRSVSAEGVAGTPPLLAPDECDALVAMYAQPQHFRSRVEMARFNFGVGDYQYFAYPLPPAVAALRHAMYPHLAPIANRWHEELGIATRYPPTLDVFLAACHAAGQSRPTPLLLHYEAGGYNCLHQDLYGELVFPIQLVVFLSEPGLDHDGGEFLIVEQRPRAQSVATVVSGTKGSAALFTTRHRPAKGTRGFYRVNVRHGVSRVRRGERYTLGVIFHDAK